MTWGKIYHQFANYGLAYDNLQKAYRLFNSFSSIELHALQQFGCQCGVDLVDAARFVLPWDEVVTLAQEVEIKCADISNDLIHGRSLLFVGLASQEARRRKETLNYLQQARTILTAIGNVPHLAHVYQVLTRVYNYEKRLPEALDAIIEARKQARLSESPFFQAFISIDFGMVLYSLDRDSEAWKQIEMALIKASHVGDQHSVALAMDYMGYGYLRRGDYRNALQAYEAAVGKFPGTKR